MAETNSDLDTRRDIQDRLFSDGERLGWEFRDRTAGWRHFTEPPPQPPPEDPALERRLRRAEHRQRGALAWAGAGAAIALAIGWYDSSVLWSGGASGSALVLVLVLAAIAALAVAWLVVLRPVRLAARVQAAHHAIEWTRARNAAEHSAAMTAWRQRHDAHTAAEWRRLEDTPEWGAVRIGSGARRLDVFGGSLESWEGFLTTFGSSMVAQAPPVRVLDFSEGMVAGELCHLTAGGGRPVSVQVLPQQLATCDLLAGLDARRLAELLVESIHGDAGGEARAVDARILAAVCETIVPELSLARLHEGLLALLGDRHAASLSTAERDRITGGLFSPGYVTQVEGRVRALEAHLHPLRDLGTAALSRHAADAVLRCLTVGGEEPMFATSLFGDLALRWATHGAGAAASADRQGTLIVAGADRLRRRQLERLADTCERRRIRLAYLFRHLRDDAAHLLGGGTAMFMRLGNHEEAERAARFIGRGHRFVVSQVTQSHGGGHTHAAETQHDQTLGKSRTRVGFSLSSFGSASTRSRRWGVANSHAERTDWHHAETRRRVYEYQVEPTVLQSLPEYALLVVQHGGGEGTHLRVADCNPDILSLPRVLTEPLPAPSPTTFAARDWSPAERLVPPAQSPP